MITNKKEGTLYVGQSSNLVRRMWEHKNKLRKGFSARYNLDKLVWYESFETREAALTRERRIKEWQRAWKIEKIVERNPNWDDLTEGLSIF